MKTLEEEAETKPIEKYWYRDDVQAILKGKKGEFIIFNNTGITLSKKQDELCNEVLEVLNRRYKRQGK